jgi:asparagine synthase (glutamine-hydrolysing)
VKGACTKVCGIVGIASVKPVVSRDWISRGAKLMQHRGPDDHGEWWSEDHRVGFAHQRLAIIDLSRAGHQPMISGLRNSIITYNGEIYNYLEIRKTLIAQGVSFVSQSDTEVILAAYEIWGKDCLHKLNGMFSFAIYDVERQTVIIARDRAGEKPLFYHLADGVLRFASELKALLSDGTLDSRVESKSLDCLLALGFIPGQDCILQGFQKLSPAHALEFSIETGNFNVWRYWRPPEYQRVAGGIDEGELVNQLGLLLEGAVRQQMIADVPVGVLLSGGVDSSLITAMAARMSNKVRTYTIRIPGFGQLDEAEHARLVSDYFSTDHTELEAEPPGPELLFSLAKQFDEPIADSSLIPTFLVSKLVRQHCTVALSGDGGDELFGGYSGYSSLLALKQRTQYVPYVLRKYLSSMAEWYFPAGVKGRNWLRSLGTDFENGLSLSTSFFDTSTRKQLLQQYPDWEFVAENVRRKRMSRNPDLLQRMTRTDFDNYLPDDILVKVDRASMLASLEVRAPFLDYRLIEFAYKQVPSILKATPHHKKILLRKLTENLLPPEFDRQRKQGFSIPLASWLKSGAFRDLFYDVLTDSHGTFDKKTVQQLLQGQDRGRSNADRLFALVMFELWKREYGISI